MKKTITLLAFLCCMHFATAQNNIENLFNGKDLSNWEFVVDGNSVSPSDVFGIQNGVIHIKGKPFGYMYTQKKYNNYHLHAEWRWIGEATNSGIFLQIAEIKNPFPNGVECQLKAGSAGDIVLLGGSDMKEYKLPADGVRPKFPVINRTNSSSEYATGEWNSADIYVYNGIVTIYINGVFQNTGTNTVKEGHIALQSEGGDIQFRNIKLAEIK